VGTVVSDKMQKTVNVAVDRYRIHPKYHKRLKYTRKFMAHDEAEVANMGDLVMIVPCHKISKMKHFMLREIIKRTGQL
jgi:small subunit ribosomal protein S17